MAYFGFTNKLLKGQTIQIHMMNKLVIANRGAGNIGKSSSVKSVYQLLKDNGHKLLVEEWQGEDIKAIFEINGVKVGIESQGDPDSQMEPTMEAFVVAGCEIIVTAYRTKSYTYEKVWKYLGEEHGYNVLWAAHYVFTAPGADDTRALPTPASLTKCINSFRTESTM